MRKSEKFKIYSEPGKDRLTTHWDLDYMTSADLEKEFERSSGGDAPHEIDERTTCSDESKL